MIVLSLLLVPIAAMVGVVRRWQVCLTSLGALYLLVAAIEGAAVSPLIGASQIVVGATTLSVLYLSANQIFGETRTAIHGRLPTWEYLFESVVAAVAAIGAGLFARAHPLFQLPGPVSFAWAWLGLAGLFMVILAGNILEVGLGLLVFDCGLNLLVLSTSPNAWWPSLLMVQLVPIALALLVSVIGARLAHFGQGVGLELLKEKAPFVVASAGPVRVHVRRRGQPGGGSRS